MAAATACLIAIVIGCGGRDQTKTERAAIQMVCRRATVRIMRLPLPVRHRTDPYRRLVSAESVIDDEAQGLRKVRPASSQASAANRLAAALNYLADYVHTVAEAVRQPTEALASSDYAEPNYELQIRLRRVVSASSTGPLEEAGCVPPRRLGQVLVAHTFY